MQVHDELVRDQQGFATPAFKTLHRGREAWRRAA
jgi:hypothetical protein